MLVFILIYLKFPLRVSDQVQWQSDRRVHPWKDRVQVNLSCAIAFFLICLFSNDGRQLGLRAGSLCRFTVHRLTNVERTGRWIDVQETVVVPCVIRKKQRFAPKILKKKSSLNKISKEPNVKRVTFEVEQLLTREGSVQDRNAARERLVVSLGGKMAKGKAMNYKLLKQERKHQKEEERKKATEMKALLRVNSAKKKTK
ncbi:unnamed protein product [Nippostrongylus brasiliensis]|uniref:40S ribosomal protein S6 n=1 Tax=Nippostrongylus brasiliensis TaxID=27835 RepID=A0A158QX21_NIPBR|nr:unnamed protein product [Nippostrongylus brasiliensis]